MAGQSNAYGLAVGLWSKCARAAASDREADGLVPIQPTTCLEV
jgi:hypothetical protein